MKNNLELRDYFWDTLMIFFHACGESLLDVVEYKRKQTLIFPKRKTLENIV